MLPKDNFFPLVMATSGSMGKLFREFLGHIAQYDVSLATIWDLDTLYAEHIDLTVGHLTKEINIARAEADIRQIRLWSNSIITDFGSGHHNPKQRAGRPFEHNYHRNIDVRSASRSRHRI